MVRAQRAVLSRPGRTGGVPRAPVAAPATRAASAARVLALQRAAGNRATAAALRAEVSRPGGRSLLPLAEPSAQFVIQRELSEGAFVADTTSSLLWCIQWRVGPDDQLQDMQAKLRAFERARSPVEKVQAIDALVAQAQANNKRGIPAKYKQALLNVISEARQVRGQLEDDHPEVGEHQRRVARERDAAATAKQQEEARKLAALTIAQRVAAGDQSHRSTVETLVRGIREEDSDDTRLDKLFANFRHLGFRYIMTANSYTKLLAGDLQGDCRTLAETFQHVAQNVLGVPTLVDSAAKHGFDEFRAPPAAVIDGTTGNVDDGAFWVFASHYWAVSKGRTFDLLFMTKEVSTARWTKSEAVEGEGFKFGDLEVERNPHESSVATKWRTKVPVRTVT